MPTPVQHYRRVLFGPFEFNPRAGELRKHGMVIRLPEQPFAEQAMLEHLHTVGPDLISKPRR